MLRLYDFWESGNAYKVILLLTQLEQAFERVHLDLLKGETHTPEYLAVNPNHHVPVVEWPNGRRLTESNAILFYLAEGSGYLPESTWERAQILQWQNFEQNSHEPYVAVVRFWHFAGLLEENQDALPAKVSGGYRALDVMEGHLSSNDFFVGSGYSIADISLYAYTHVADEGNFDLDRYPAIRKWLDRIADQSRHIKITDDVGTLVAWP